MLVGKARDVKDVAFRISALAVAPLPVYPPAISTVPSSRRVAVCPTLFSVILGPSFQVSDAKSNISVLSAGPAAVRPPVTRMFPSARTTTAGADLAIRRDGASFHSYFLVSHDL